MPQQAQYQAQGQALNADAVMREFQELNDKYYEQVKTSVNALVDCKVAVHKHDKILDDQIDEYRAKIGEIEGNISALQEENEALEKL